MVPQTKIRGELKGIGALRATVSTGVESNTLNLSAPGWRGMPRILANYREDCTFFEARADTSARI